MRPGATVSAPMRRYTVLTHFPSHSKQRCTISQAPQLSRRVAKAEMQAAAGELRADLSMLHQRTFNLADNDGDDRVDKKEWVAFHVKGGLLDEAAATAAWDMAIEGCVDSEALLMTDWVAYHSKATVTMSEEEVRDIALPEVEQQIDQLMERFHPPEDTIAQLEAAFPSMTLAR